MFHNYTKLTELQVWTAVGSRKDMKSFWTEW